MANDPLKPSAIGASLPRTTRGSTPGVGTGAAVPGMGKKTSVPSGPAPAEQTEKVHISKAARELLRQSELMADAQQKLQSQGDVRQDRVAEVRAKIEAGAYDSKAVKNELAQRLANILGDLPYSGDSGS